jgi:chromosome partitioning protein
LAALKNLKNVIGIIPEKELVNASMLAKKGILEYATESDKLREQKQFIELIQNVFKKIEKEGNN